MQFTPILSVRLLFIRTIQYTMSFPPRLQLSVGDGWLFEQKRSPLFWLWRLLPGTLSTIKSSNEPEVERLSSSEPTQVTDFSVLPTMGGFYRGKVGGRY